MKERTLELLYVQQELNTDSTEDEPQPHPSSEALQQHIRDTEDATALPANSNTEALQCQFQRQDKSGYLSLTGF